VINGDGDRKFVRGNMCPKCGKAVYFAEEVSAVGKKYHKLCLRCGKDNVGIIVMLKEYIKTGDTV
jgi:predicted nucleic-acid-binding Zn-ribbon protein